MERVNLPNTPTGLSPMDAVLDYRFDGNKYARVILEMSEGEMDHFKIKAQAYEVDENGVYVMAPKGYPSRTRQTNHTIPRSSLGDTATLAPGWIRVVPQSGQNIDSNNLPSGTEVLSEKPETGSVGDHVYIDPHLYRFDNGIARATAEEKIKELRVILQNSAPLSNLGFDHTAI